MLIKTGGEADPQNLAGLAGMTAELLTQGTASRSAPEIAEAIEVLGGSIESGAGWDSSLAQVEVMTEKADAAINILADVVRRPSFKDEEIERLRQQTLDELSVSLSQPGTLARYAAARVLFGDTPYAHPLSGTPESLAQIKRPDIARLHNTYYRPDNAVLLIGGNIKADAAFGLAERYFGDWAKPASALLTRTAEAPAVAIKSVRVIVVDKPDAGQAAVLLVRPGLKRAESDYYTGLVTNSVLGGGYSARLNQEVRIKRGLSYGASSALDVRRETGPFTAATQTKNQSAAEVASVLIGELRRLSSDAVPAEELVPRKAALIGTTSLALETNKGLVTYLGSLALHNLSLDEINKYIDQIQAVNVEGIQRFARSRLNADEAQIVIVGNAQEFLPDLRQKFTEVEVIPFTELDLNTASLRRARAK
ncbi:MAG: pitrilysin family protein [Pyrinomonadaceae bacterium]